MLRRDVRPRRHCNLAFWLQIQLRLVDREGEGFVVFLMLVLRVSSRQRASEGGVVYGRQGKHGAIRYRPCAQRARVEPHAFVGTTYRLKLLWELGVYTAQHPSDQDCLNVVIVLEEMMCS